MNEMPKKFIIDSAEAVPMSDLEKKIDLLYAQVRDHEDFEKFEAFYTAVAEFSEHLSELFPQAALQQVKAYHALIRSGVPAAHVLESPPHTEAIEKEIEAFVLKQAEALGTAEASAD